MRFLTTRTAKISALMFLAAISLTGCGENTSAPQQQIELNISAAASLKDALGEIQKNYHGKNPNVKILYNFGASGSLQKQIEQGAPADIFISAAPKQMDELEQKKLINKATRRNLVENRLTVVVPKDSQLNITGFEDLLSGSVQKIALGETAVVPAGQYAEQVFTKLGIGSEIKNKTVYAKDIRTVLTYTETGNVDAGVVYKTDAISSDKVKIAALAPDSSHQPIVYPIAVLANTKQPKAADDFAMYLFSDESKAVFEKYGFSMSNAGD